MKRLQWRLVMCAAVAAAVLLLPLRSESLTRRMSIVPTPATTVHPLDRAFPASSDLLPVRTTSASTLAPEGFRPQSDPTGHWRNPAKPVEPVFPLTFSEPVRVRCGEADVAARPLNANSSAAKIEADGSLVYENAFDGADVHYRCSAYKTEEFIVVRDAASQRTFAWDLETRGLKARLTPAHTIELCDDASVPRLRINAPIGKDAHGRVLREGSEISYAIEGSRLTMTARMEGCAFPVVIDPTWSSTGTMAVDHAGGTLTLLQNGNALFAGGFGGAGPSFLTACELYDQTSQTWSSTGSLGVARSSHTATLLQDGTVLVAGGGNGSLAATCEIYNPTSRTWSDTNGALGTLRSDHAAVRLSSGEVLACGGINNGQLQSCELYNPTSKTWSGTGSWTISRSAPNSVTLLSDGSVLAGNGQAGNTSDFERFSGGTWSPAGTLAVDRPGLRAVRLADGRVLACGTQHDAQIFNPSTNTWALTTPMILEHAQHTATALSNGLVLVAGGDTATNKACEVFNPSNGNWVRTADLLSPRQGHLAVLLQNGTVLVAGNASVGTTSSEIFDPRPVSTPLTLSVHSGARTTLPLSSNAIGTSPVMTIESPPSHGFIFGGANFDYASTLGFIGTDTFLYRTSDSFGSGPMALVTLNVTNTPPTVSASVSPPVIESGETVAFSGSGSDPDEDSISYSWNFGDGSTSTEQNPSHTYTSEGTFTAVLTVIDSIGATAKTTVVVKIGRRPTARFTTSDVVGFVGIPLAFDAVYSSDPENAIVGYSWNFGDGSPAGSGKDISRVYENAGTYVVTLTVTDEDGQTGSTSRLIEVLPADQAGTFNGFVDYAVKWDSFRDNTDSLTLTAALNVGDTTVASKTVVAVEIAGNRFTGTLDAKLRDNHDPNEKWQVKANLRGQSFGSVFLRLTVKKASLSSGFAAAGAVPEFDPDGTVTATIPVRIEIGGRAFELRVPSEFDFLKGGFKARGSGETE